jgi:hypothetical protein
MWLQLWLQPKNDRGDWPTWPELQVLKQLYRYGKPGLTARLFLECRVPPIRDQDRCPIGRTPPPLRPALGQGGKARDLDWATWIETGVKPRGWPLQYFANHAISILLHCCRPATYMIVAAV